MIQIARELARRDAGRPKSESLRRAVSSAYYALFHALAYLCADELVSWSRPYAVVTPIYRSLDHAKARSSLNAARQRRPRNPLLDTIAVTFAVLQDARFDADYDPEPFRFNRSSTLDLIDGAERAIAAIRALSADQRLALAVDLVAKPRRQNASP